MSIADVIAGIGRIAESLVASKRSEEFCKGREQGLLEGEEEGVATFKANVVAWLNMRASEDGPTVQIAYGMAADSIESGAVERYVAERNKK